MLNIVDRPGVMPKEELRMRFEECIKSTPLLRKSTPLGTVTFNGTFSHYANSDTDTMWLGFAIGMRYAERVQTAIDTALRQKGDTNAQPQGEPHEKTHSDGN